MRANLEWLFRNNTIHVSLPRLPIYDLRPIICNFSNAVMNIVSLLRSNSTLGALWEANMPFEIRHMRDMKTNISVKILFFPQIMTLREPLREGVWIWNPRIHQKESLLEWILQNCYKHSLMKKSLAIRHENKHNTWFFKNT